MIVEASVTGIFRTILIIIGTLALLRFLGRIMIAKRNLEEERSIFKAQRKYIFSLHNKIYLKRLIRELYFEITLISHTKFCFLLIGLISLFSSYLVKQLTQASIERNKPIKFLFPINRSLS